jgi:ParB family chromosome partitioning protein
VRGLVIEGRLGMGHARALLGLESDDSIERLARQTVARSLSVRQVETLVRRERSPSPPASPARQSAAARDLTERLQRALGTRVKIVESGAGKGHLEIYYSSLDELDGILGKILPG